VEHFQADMAGVPDGSFGLRTALPRLLELIEKTGRSVFSQGCQTKRLFELNRESHAITHGPQLLRLLLPLLSHSGFNSPTCMLMEMLESAFSFAVAHRSASWEIR
jgi:hypothetical protein